MGFKEKKRLLRIYDAEVDQRHTEPSESKTYSKATIRKHPDVAGWTFGCAELLPYLKEEFDECDPLSLLDFGCGAGSDLAVYSREMNVTNAVGIDICKRMLERASHLPDKIEWIVGDHNDLGKIDEKFDCITTNAVIHLMQDKLSVLSHLNEKLKPSGVLFSSEFVTRQPLPQIFRDHYEASDGLFLFGGLIDRQGYLDLHFDAGFQEVEILKTLSFNPKSQITNLIKNSSISNSTSIINELKNIDFQIIIVRAKNNIAYENIAFQCSNCLKLNHSNTAFYRSLNIQIHKLLVKNMRNTQWTECYDCQNVQFMAPFQIHDMHSRKMAFCFPSNMEIYKERLEKDLMLQFKHRLPNYQMAMCFCPTELFDFLPSLDQ